MANVIVQGSFSVNPDEREQFIQASIEGMHSSRAEDGCLEYVLAPDPADPGRVVLSERWESKGHLDKHFEGLMARRAAPAPDAQVRPAPLSTEIMVYEVASAAPLM